MSETPFLAQTLCPRCSLCLGGAKSTYTCVQLNLLESSAHVQTREKEEVPWRHEPLMCHQCRTSPCSAAKPNSRVSGASSGSTVTCRHWPIGWAGIPHRPQSSTSGTCSCSVHCASAAGYCVLDHSTGSHSCPCLDWFCCRGAPAYPWSPGLVLSRRNQVIFQSRPDHWC